MRTAAVYVDAPTGRVRLGGTLIRDIASQDNEKVYLVGRFHGQFFVPHFFATSGYYATARSLLNSPPSVGAVDATKITSWSAQEGKTLIWYVILLRESNGRITKLVVSNPDEWVAMNNRIVRVYGVVIDKKFQVERYEFVENYQ